MRSREGASRSSTPATKAAISCTATAGYRSRSTTSTTAVTTAAPTMRASSGMESPPAEDRLHVTEQLRDELNEPEQHDDDPGQAQHLRLLLAAGLGQEDVQNRDDDAQTRNLVNHRDVQRRRTSRQASAMTSRPPTHTPSQRHSRACTAASASASCC